MHQLISMQKAAELIGCDPKTIRRRVSDGTLTGYRVGPRAMRVDLAEVEANLIRPMATVATVSGR